MTSPKPTEPKRPIDGDSDPLWHPYHYSRKSIVACVGAGVLYLIVLGSLPLGNWGMLSTGWFLLYAAGMFLIPTVFYYPQTRRQKKERQKNGELVSRFSKKRKFAFYSSYVLYSIVADSFKVSVKLEHLLNKIFGNPDNVPPRTAQTLLEMFLVLVLPMLILAWIFFGPQYYRQRRERRAMRHPGS